MRPLRWSAFLSDRAGVAALELALVAPFMVTLLMGTIELGNTFRIQAKVNTATGQLAELVAGEQSVTAQGGSLADMCTGARMNLLPFNGATFAADIASMTNDHPSNRVAGSTDSTTVAPYLDWENISSCSTTSSTTMGSSGVFARANSPSSLLTTSGAPATQPSGSQYAMGYSAIVVQATYVYSNILPMFLARTITFTGIAVARPRQNSEIMCTNTAGTVACPSLQ